jgi:hypothetical protein
VQVGARADTVEVDHRLHHVLPDLWRRHVQHEQAALRCAAALQKRANLVELLLDGADRLGEVVAVGEDAELGDDRASGIRWAANL